MMAPVHTTLQKLRRDVQTNAIATGVIRLDPYLEPYKGVLKRRHTKAQEWIKKFTDAEGSLEKFSRVRLIS